MYHRMVFVVLHKAHKENNPRFHIESLLQKKILESL